MQSSQNKSLYSKLVRVTNNNMPQDWRFNRSRSVGAGCRFLHESVQSRKNYGIFCGLVETEEIFILKKRGKLELGQRLLDTYELKYVRIIRN